MLYRALVLCAGLLGVFTATPFVVAETKEGPEIKVISPEPAPTPIHPPVDLDIRFIAPADATIDPNSVKVEVHKLWSIDVTEKVKPYVNGNGIRMTGLELPVGHHTLSVTIADDKGRISSETMTVDIK